MSERSGIPNHTMEFFSEDRLWRVDTSETTSGDCTERERRGDRIFYLVWAADQLVRFQFASVPEAKQEPSFESVCAEGSCPDSVQMRRLVPILF